jgi:hypothetical protein
VDYKTAYHVSTQQTSPHCAANETRVDEYVRHFKKDCWALPKQVRYVVTDAYYTKTLITEAILEQGLHQIGKLRHDANLRYLYQGPQKAKGRPRQYDGKFKLGETARLSFVAHQEGVDIYTAVVNCVHLKQAIRLVYVEKKLAQGTKRALLFSTDTSLDEDAIGFIIKYVDCAVPVITYKNNRLCICHGHTWAKHCKSRCTPDC